MARLSDGQPSRSRSRAHTASPAGGASPSSWGFAERISGGRLAAVFILFALVALVIAVRLVWVQIIDAQEISERESSRTVTQEIAPRRGTIYDRNGVVLATTVDAYNVYCHPRMVDASEHDRLAQALVDVFGGEKERYLELMQQDTNFVYLYRNADTTKGEQIKALGIEGVDLESTSKRVYPCGQTASQIIGILNSEGNAISGLELYYDDILGGVPGKRTTEYSAEGVPVPGATTIESEVVNGKDIVLTIDVGLQEALEQALLLRVETVQGDGGFSVVMDADTGEIYAGASAPTFNITDLSEVKEGATNLSGISGTFEPGSIFKPVAMLAALEAQTTTAGQVYHCPSVLEVGDYTIADAHERAAEDMDTTAIMARSSNVGMSLIAEDMGFETLYNYIQKYQILEATNVDYPGAVSGSVADWQDWSVVQGYNISFGQGIVVTPLEMVRFYGALANGGYNTTPHFLMDVPTDSEDRTYTTTEIIENKTALANVNSMLEAVVSEGTGTPAQIEGYRVAGKTGTAQIGTAQGYKVGSYDISFVGFLPDASLNLVCYVGATEVPADRETASAFQDIMEYAIDRYNITQE